MVARCVAVACVQCRRSPDETGGGGGWWVCVHGVFVHDDQTAQRRSRPGVPMVRAICHAINRHVVERIAKFMVATPPWL